MREVEKSLPNYSAGLKHVKGWREERNGTRNVSNHSCSSKKVWGRLTGFRSKQCSVKES